MEGESSQKPLLRKGDAQYRVQRTVNDLIQALKNAGVDISADSEKRSKLVEATMKDLSENFTIYDC